MSVKINIPIMLTILDAASFYELFYEKMIS
jgi:hypothetical protein